MTANSLSFWPSAAATVSTWHRFCAPCSGCGPSGSRARPVSVQSDDGQDWVKALTSAAHDGSVLWIPFSANRKMTADLRVARERP